MIVINENLYVGNQDDYESNVKFKDGWAVVHACKEPYHRQALGYSGRAIAKDHPEYLIAHRDNRLILNLVDVDNVDWINSIIIDEAIEFIGKMLSDGKKVLIHCNQGISRSPGIALLYLATKGFYSGKDFPSSEHEFKQICPAYNPAKGMRDYMSINWGKYCK
jgi:predicted protein tyrosine phosphatase